MCFSLMSWISWGTSFQITGPLQLKLFVLIKVRPKGFLTWLGSLSWLRRFIWVDSLLRVTRFFIDSGALLLIMSCISVALWCLYNSSSLNKPSDFSLGSVWELKNDLLTVRIARFWIVIILFVFWTVHPPQAERPYCRCGSTREL